jgi:D-threo-aldose 1-dehydrogenase
LKKRPFGGTGHDVTPIGLGTIALGRSPRVKSDAQAVEIVRATFEAGVNFIDTAPLYGVAERRLGAALKALAGDVPDDLVINTKAGYRPDPFDYSEQQTIACVEKSLDLLGLDFIHYVHIHDVERAEIAVVLNGALKGLQELKQQKVVGHIGVAGGPIDLLTEYIETGEFESVITHNRFNLLDRPAAALIDRANDLGMAVVNAAPFASGILAQPENPDTPYVYHLAPQEVKNRVERIAAICKDFGVEVPAAAVGFSTRNAKVAVTVLGAATTAEIMAAAEAAEMDFDPELWTVIEREAPPNLVDDVEEWRKLCARPSTL